MKVAILGRTRMLSEAARALHEHGHEVVIVVAPDGARHAVDASALRDLAHELSCPFLATSDLGGLTALATLADSGAEVAVSVNWTTLVPPQVFELFAHGVLNAHAGDLPRYRGNATVAWAILACESEVVLTVHRMDAGLDSGPVLAKRACPLDESTYVADVYAWCERTVPAMFVEVLDGLAGGTLSAVAQPAHDPGLRCFPRTAMDGWIDWARDAAALARLVRASSEPFAGAYTAWGTERLTIWRAHGEALPYDHLGVPGQVVELRARTGEVAVLTASGVLVLERVQPAGQPAVAAAELLTSTRARLGLHVPTALDDLIGRVAALERRLAEEAS